MKYLKRLFLLCLIVFSLSFLGCETTNDIRCANFTNITMAGSDKHTLKIIYEKDKRVDEKYVDIQVKSNKLATVKFNKENEEIINLTFDDTNFNSLTTLIVQAKGMETYEDFKKYKETQSKTLIFSGNEEVLLTFKVVVGDKTENATNTGYILTNSKEISKEFNLKLAKK